MKRYLIIPEYIYAVEFDSKGESTQVFPPISEEEQIKRCDRIREDNEQLERERANPSKDREPIDIDKLIRESGYPFRDFWITVKQNHPELCKPVLPVDEPEINMKPQLQCLRCNATWTQKGEKLPIQCPKCRSAYWNKERQK